MAMRLATEYVKTCLKLSEAEMDQFIRMFVEHGASLQVKVLENGNQEIVLPDDAGQEIVLSFEKEMGLYVCRGTCRITNKNLVNAMRKAVSVFKGDAVVHRIYESYIMEYTYAKGAVMRIVEKTAETEKLIYEYRNTLGQLEQLFRSNTAELEITTVKSQINGLLDLRNQIENKGIREQIDERLQKLTHQLFVLEA